MSFNGADDGSVPVLSHVSPESKSGCADPPTKPASTAVLRSRVLVFLAALLSSRLSSRSLSRCSVPLRIPDLQAGRSWAMSCHFATGMLQALRVDLSTSFYLCRCPPWCRFPIDSSAWNSCFGSLLSSMRVTCPAQRNCAWPSIASMPGSSALRRISWFGTWSSQLTPRTLQRQRR